MIKLLLLLLSIALFAEEPKSNQSHVADPKRLQEAYNLMQETNKTCWTLIELHKALESKKLFIRSRSSAEEDKIFCDRLTKIQASLDKNPCNRKLEELTEKIKGLTATEQQILRDSKEFNHPELSKFGSLIGMSSAYHYHIIDTNRAVKAENAFYSTDRVGQILDEQNDNQPLSLEYCKELAKQLDEKGSIEDIQQK
jgi:hypothetical protein